MVWKMVQNKVVCKAFVDNQINLTSLQLRMFLRFQFRVIQICQKLRHPEKATNFEKKYGLLSNVKQVGDFFQIFVAFSENMNFTGYSNIKVYEHYYSYTKYVRTHLFYLERIWFFPQNKVGKRPWQYWFPMRSPNFLMSVSTEAKVML